MPRRETDRNLLFGILALQMDFITRDALVAAMNAWVMEKHRTLGEILVERKALDPFDRALLDTMVNRHIANHNGDPAASLAAVSSIESVADELRRGVDDPDVLASIAQISIDPHATRAPETADFIPAGIRYHKVRDHAEGGLGIVFVARDSELNREVALKEIKSKYADNPGSQARFLVEAEITGGLEHPGIVPVYGLGHYDDGRPFYAMRFIRGDSLKHAIAAFHADDKMNRDPGARTLAVQKLLRRFLDVCNAIAYAHSRGVLHRDLKPDNVMVGRYGETLVVDWGLAKAVGRSGGDDFGPMPESTVMIPSGSGSAETIPGSIVGTPGYMSPEQAAGRLDLLGPASDVYSLGATLYSLLTARVPIAGKDITEVLRKVERGDFARPREASPWLDPALEAICLKAMALKPESRYISPRALAEDIERWLADEPVKAYREPFFRRTRRFARRHRTPLSIAATAATVTALLLGNFAWQRYDRRRTAETTSSVLLAEADRLASEAQAGGDPTAWIKAIAEAQRAVDQLESGGGAVSDAKSRLERLQADSRMVAELDEAQIRGASVKDGTFDYRGKLDAYQAAFRGYGIDLASLPVEEAAKKIRSSRIVDDLISALDDWSCYKTTKIPRERLDAIVRAADTDPNRLAIRDAVAHEDRGGLRRLCEKEEDRRKLGPRIRYVFESLLRLDPAGSFPLLESIRRETPSDFWLNQDLGTAYKRAKPPQAQEAVRCLSMATALRPKSPGAHLNLGNALMVQGKLNDAVAEYRIAIRLKPEYAEAHTNLGDALRDQRKLNDAVAEYRIAIRLKPEYAEAHTNLGVTLQVQGKTDDAIAEYHAAIRFNPELAEAYTNLGLALQVQGKLDDAIAEHHAAIRFNPELAMPHYNLGIALKAQGKLNEAIAEYHAAIRINPELAEAHVKLGFALKDQGKLDGTIAEFREAVRIKPDFAEVYSLLGTTLCAQGKLDDAIVEYHTAIRINPKLADAYYGLGNALYAQGKLDDAIAAYNTAIRVEPNLVEAHCNMGNALQVQRKLDDAIAEYRTAIQLNPNLMEAYSGLGDALRDQRKLGDAIVVYSTALRIKPDHAEVYYNLANLLRDQGKLDDAVAAYGQAIRIKPDYAEAFCNLGLVQGQKGLFRESLENLKRGHEIGSRQRNWRNPSEAWVRNARRLVDLEAKLPAILKGEVTPKDAAERLTLADMCSRKGLQTASARFWDEAFAEQPTLADNLTKSSRYNAACAASLAGSGSGKDEPAPDEAARVKLREKALGWLRADLAAWTNVLDGVIESTHKQAVAKKLARWKEDSDLAGIRDEASLAKLPEGEREGFRSLWREVESLRKKAMGE